VLEEHPFRALKPLKTDRTGRVRYLHAPEESGLREAMSRREVTLREARMHFNEEAFSPPFGNKSVEAMRTDALP
jgi:hypothetical protein